MTWCHRGGKMISRRCATAISICTRWTRRRQGEALTNAPGYDGGAFYNADCTQIVWRANHPAGPALDEYRRCWRGTRQAAAHGAVRDERRRHEPAADHEQRRGEFLPVLPERRQADHLRVERECDAGFEFDLWTIGRTVRDWSASRPRPASTASCVFSPDGEAGASSAGRANAGTRGVGNLRIEMEKIAAVAAAGTAASGRLGRGPPSETPADHKPAGHQRYLVAVTDVRPVVGAPVSSTPSTVRSAVTLPKRRSSGDRSRREVMTDLTMRWHRCGTRGC